MNEVAIMENVSALIQWGLVVVGGASVGVRTLAVLTAITPWTWDDEGLNKLGKVIVPIQRILNTIALNWGASQSQVGRK